MINRELIRLKIVQITYAYYLNQGKGLDTAEKELFFSLSKTYDLYNYLLLLMVEINRIAIRSVDTARARARRLHEDESAISDKFIRNRFILQLEQNIQLNEYCEEQKRSWYENEELVRALYNRIVSSDFYLEYMNSGEDSYDEDRELWRKIYRRIICNNEQLDNVLEDLSLYWNDDKAIVDTFVLKTIRRFDEQMKADQPLMPEYNGNEDREYASKLFRHTIQNAAYYRELVAGQTRNWDVSRVAAMDMIIMQVALAEIISFPDIPVSVSINEYVDIAKMYSAPRSAGYVNATLDNISKRLIAEKKILAKKSTRK